MINKGTTKLVNPNASRSSSQRIIMEGYQKNGICPFCPEHFLPDHSEEIISQGTLWLVTHNKWPYKHTKYQFLLILKRHADNFSDITSEEWEELREHIVILQREFNITGGAVAMRFGDITENGASIAHLHAHIVVSDNCGEGHEPVKVKVG